MDGEPDGKGGGLLSGLCRRALYGANNSSFQTCWRQIQASAASSPVAFTPLCTVHVRAESSGVSSCHSCADEDGAGFFFFFGLLPGLAWEAEGIWIRSHVVCKAAEKFGVCRL